MVKKILVGRLGESKNIIVDDNTTIQSAFTQAGLTVLPTEKVMNIKGEVMSLSSVVEDGSGYIISENVKDAQ